MLGRQSDAPTKSIAQHRSGCSADWQTRKSNVMSGSPKGECPHGKRS